MRGTQIRIQVHLCETVVGDEFHEGDGFWLIKKIMIQIQCSALHVD